MRWGISAPRSAFVQGARVRCYIEDNGIGIHRMDDAVCQMYDFAQGHWNNSTEIMDMFIGELWAEEVGEAEADAFIAKRPANSEGKGVPTGWRDAKTLQHTRMCSACSSAMDCTSARYHRLDGGFFLNESKIIEANSVTPRVAAESTPCDNGTDSSGQESMPAAKGERQSSYGGLQRDANGSHMPRAAVIGRRFA